MPLIIPSGRAHLVRLVQANCNYGALAKSFPKGVGRKGWLGAGLDMIQRVHALACLRVGQRAGRPTPIPEDPDMLASTESMEMTVKSRSSVSPESG